MEDPNHHVDHNLIPWKSTESTLKKRSFRRLSFFKPAEDHPSVSPVLTTNTINKEYDPETGNKIINNFMIIKEIGRGMHGKVKLAEDLDTGELVVSFLSFFVFIFFSFTPYYHQSSLTSFSFFFSPFI